MLILEVLRKHWEFKKMGIYIKRSTIKRSTILSLLEVAGCTSDDLRKLLLEVTGLLNSRPLTYVSSDPNDLRPLTPNDLMNKPPISHRPTSTANTDTALPKERFRYVQKLCNLFWDLWTKQYLPSIIGRSKRKQKQRDFKIGDIVLIADPNLARGKWHTGTVCEVHPSKDKMVRQVQVKTEDGVYKRPIHRLCLLETIEDQQNKVQVKTNQ